MTNSNLAQQEPLVHSNAQLSLGAIDQPPSQTTWRSWLASIDTLKVLAATGAVAGLLLHLIGTVWQDEYLRRWGLEAAAFPKTADRIVIQGYEAVVGLSLKVLPTVLTNVLYIVFASLVISLYWSLFKVGESGQDSRKSPPAWVLRLPIWIQHSFNRFFILLGSSVFLLLFVLFLSIVLALPIILGEVTARQHADDELVAFAKGCSAAKETKCFDLKIGANTFRGFLIDSSQDNIAFYDVAIHRARVVSRTGVEILGAPLPQSAPASGTVK